MVISICRPYRTLHHCPEGGNFHPFPPPRLMRAVFESVASATKTTARRWGGGVRQDFEFQSWLLRLDVRYLTGGSDVGYILSTGRADVKQLRELKL